MTPRSLAALLMSLALPGCVQASERRLDAVDEPPRVVLWAWERSEDLRFLDRRDVGVAFLASTIAARGGGLSLSPRRQPLRLPDSTWRSAVVRIESAAREPATLSPAQRAGIVEEAKRVSLLPFVRGVQIDFDAAKSQRAGYRLLLGELRAALPPRTALSMTALASWCMFDDWLSTSPLPVDEVVPMLFTMGRDSEPVWRSLDETGDFRSAACKSSVGVQSGQRIPSFASRRRVYAFSAGAWDKPRYEELIRVVSP